MSNFTRVSYAKKYIYLEGKKGSFVGCGDPGVDTAVEENWRVVLFGLAPPPPPTRPVWDIWIMDITHSLHKAADMWANICFPDPLHNNFASILHDLAHHFINTLSFSILKELYFSSYFILVKPSSPIYLFTSLLTSNPTVLIDIFLYDLKSVL